MPSLRSLIAFVLGAALLAGCEATSQSQSKSPRDMSIEEARTAKHGTAVRIAGIVTVQSGAFASSIASGFAIQDGTAGIYVVDGEHVFGIGDRVQVTGKRGEEFNQQHIHLETAAKLPGSGLIVPRPVRTGRIGQADEGYLIRAAGRIGRVEDDAPYGYKIFIDDGSGELQVFIDASTTLIEAATVWKPGDLIHVVGFAGRFQDTHEIMPRVPSDISKQALD